MPKQIKASDVLEACKQDGFELNGTDDYSNVDRVAKEMGAKVPNKTIWKIIKILDDERELVEDDL